jgi:hypothetical protein
MIFSGVCAATSSMSMPPAAEAMKATWPLSRFSTRLRYSSRAIFEPSSTNTWWTGSPSGPVWWVLRRVPSIAASSFTRRLRRIDELDAAAFATAAGMHLRFDDPLRAADALRRCGSLLGIRGYIAGRHGNAVFCEQLLGLVLVQVHKMTGRTDKGRVFWSNSPPMQRRTPTA